MGFMLLQLLLMQLLQHVLLLLQLVMLLLQLMKSHHSLRHIRVCCSLRLL